MLTQLLRKHSQRYGPLRIYKETSFLKKYYSHFNYAANIFFPSEDIILETHTILCIKSRIQLFIYLSFVSFSHNPGRVCPIKLKIRMLYHMTNTFPHTGF